MSKNQGKGKVNSEDPQITVKTLTEIVSECIRCFENNEKINLLKVHDSITK